MTAQRGKWLYFVAGAAIPFALLFLFFCFLWVKDVHEDRKHVVIVEASTPFFDGVGDEGGCHGKKLIVINEATTLPVRRIHYLKDCATVDVILPNGHQGYFVLGYKVSVEPPLATY